LRLYTPRSGAKEKKFDEFIDPIADDLFIISLMPPIFYCVDGREVYILTAFFSSPIFNKSTSAVVTFRTPTILLLSIYSRLSIVFGLSRGLAAALLIKTSRPFLPRFGGLYLLLLSRRCRL
jgi:hypothetical protein